MQLGEEWIFQSDVKSPKGYLVACSFFKYHFHVVQVAFVDVEPVCERGRAALF